MASPDLHEFDESNILAFNTQGGGKAGLAKLVADRAVATKKEEDSFAERRAHWVQLVARLLDDVERVWLADLIGKEQVEVSRETVTINEEHIGSYQAPALNIAIAGAWARLQPIGTLVVGAAGRVDLTGPGGTVLLVLETPMADSKLPFSRRSFSWSIVSRAPRVVRSTLDEDSFSDALANVL